MLQFRHKLTRHCLWLWKNLAYHSLVSHGLCMGQETMDERITNFLQAHPSDRFYRHEPLVGNDSFRLVDLLPGTGNSVVVSSLSNYRLVNAHAYEALSYTWSEKTDMEFIRCDGFHLPVTNSLVVAWLGTDCQEYAPAVRQMLTRIDAAIDQIAAIGERERAQNVSTIVWDANVTVPGSKALYQLEEGLTPSAELLRTLDLPAYHSPDWVPLFSLFSCSYLKRLWVIQEVRLAKLVQLHCGGSKFDWLPVYNAIRFCFFYSFGPLKDQGLYDSEWHTFVRCFYMDSNTTLTQLMHNTSAHKCADKGTRSLQS